MIFGKIFDYFLSLSYLSFPNRAISNILQGRMLLLVLSVIKREFTETKRKEQVFCESQTKIEETEAEQKKAELKSCFINFISFVSFHESIYVKRLGIR